MAAIGGLRATKPRSIGAATMLSTQPTTLRGGVRTPALPGTAVKPPPSAPAPTQLTPEQIRQKSIAAAAKASAAASSAAQPAQPPAQPPAKARPPAGPPQAPGVGPGVTQTQFEGLDMTQYGPLEDLWRDQGHKFFQPTNSQAWWNMVAPGLTQPGQGQQWVDQNAPAYQTPGFGEGVNQEVSDSLQGPSTTQGYWDENGNFVQTPGMGENFADTTLGKYSDGTPEVTNMAGEAYNQFLGARPDIKMDAGLEEYYDFAKRRGGESLNRELAARGVYGSGRGLDKLGDMYGGLEAELANRKADYYLRALAEDRGWAGLGLQGASSADMSSLRQSENERAWMQGLGDLAFRGQGAGMDRWMAGLTGSQAADATGLARAGMRAGTATTAQGLAMDRLGQGGDFAFRAGDEELRRTMGGADIAGLADTSTLNNLNAGFNAAGGAQAAERARGQDYFNNTLATSGAFDDVFGGAYGDMLGNDQALFDAWASSLLGYDTEALNRQDRREAQSASERAAREGAGRNAIWGAGTALAPLTGGWSMAAPIAYEGLKYFDVL